MTKLRTLAIAAVMATIGAGAHAATLSGTFDVRVVNFNASGSSSGARADQTNFDARWSSATDGVSRDTFTYTGDLDFFVPNPTNEDLETISDFLSTNTTGVVDGLDIGGLRLSTPRFQTTTLFEFTEVYSNAFETRVTHDDGFTMYDDGDALFAFSNPTGVRTTPKTGTETFTGGEFRLVYSAANGNPSKLLVEGDGVPAVPLPASALLLIGGVGAMAGLRRKSRKS